MINFKTQAKLWELQTMTQWQTRENSALHFCRLHFKKIGPNESYSWRTLLLSNLVLIFQEHGHITLSAGLRFLRLLRFLCNQFSFPLRRYALRLMPDVEFHALRGYWFFWKAPDKKISLLIDICRLAICHFRYIYFISCAPKLIKCELLLVHLFKSKCTNYAGKNQFLFNESLL